MDYIWIILNPPAVTVFPKPSWKILFGSRETSVTEKELPVHTFPQGMWLTPISILFWWKFTSQKTSKIGFHSPDCCYLPSEWFCPPRSQAISPLLNSIQEFPWRHSPCCASPQAPFSSHIYSTDCNIRGGQGFHAQCRGCPRVWTPRRANITACRPCEPGQWPKRTAPCFSVCKMRVTVLQPVEPLWELDTTIHANTSKCTWCVLSTKYMLLGMIIMIQVGKKFAYLPAYMFQ